MMGVLLKLLLTASEEYGLNTVGRVVSGYSWVGHSECINILNAY